MGAPAFSVGFVALTLARSELFTENFLVTITTWIADDETRLPSVRRLRGGTIAANLPGGWVIKMLVVNAMPAVHAEVVRAGGALPSHRSRDRSIHVGRRCRNGDRSAHLARAHGPGRRGPHGGRGHGGFVLAAGLLNHTIGRALEMFGALVVGAPFGHADAAGSRRWAALGTWWAASARSPSCASS